jgi:hypothetical protein
MYGSDGTRGCNGFGGGASSFYYYNIGNWQQVALTMNAEGTVRMYINGQYAYPEYNYYGGSGPGCNRVFSLVNRTFCSIGQQSFSPFTSKW